MSRLILCNFPKNLNESQIEKIYNQANGEYELTSDRLHQLSMSIRTLNYKPGFLITPHNSVEHKLLSHFLYCTGGILSSKLSDYSRHDRNVVIFMNVLNEKYIDCILGGIMSVIDDWSLYNAKQLAKEIIKYNNAIKNKVVV